MAICAKAVQQPDGSYLLGLDPSITDFSTCAYVVETGGEWAIGSLLDLTPAQGTEIATYVIGVWALAWGFKQVARFFDGEENVQNES